jgi:hypothetical protein
MPQLDRIIPCFLLTLVFFPQRGLCQSADQPSIRAEQTTDDKVLDLIGKAWESHFDPFFGQSAIPALKEAFAKTSDRFSKENIANALIMFGQKDDAYWSLLYKRAQEIVDSNVPYPLVFDENGKSIRGAISPEFLQWVKDNNLSKDEALSEQLGNPVELSFMAEIGDPRGLPILRKGLSSPNYGVRAMAAQGLALLQDKDSIPLIIHAAKTAPSEMQWWIARPLLAFNDSTARAAAEELISDKQLLESDKQIVKEKGGSRLVAIADLCGPRASPIRGPHHKSL